jgi:endonuclease/exonuclease/phosphatase family metal-dependent hydrolase
LRFVARFRTILLWLAPLAAFAGGREMSVVTLNLAKEPSVAKMADELRSIPALRDADVFLLQEVAAGTAGPLGAALGLRVAEAPESAGAHDVELAILSRYPLRDVRLRSLGRYTLVFHSRLRYALTAVADTPGGAVRIVDTHLDTRINITDRLAQLDGAMAELPGGAALVGGDFNSNPFFWIDHVVPLPALPPQSARVEQHMRGRGFESSIPRSATTFDYLAMHLDWIWLRGLRTTSWRVYPLKFSDHHACWARISP